MSGSATPPGASAVALVERLGGHPLTRLAIEPSRGEKELERWWIAALLLSSRRDAARADSAFEALREAGLADLAALAAATPESVAGHLEKAGARDPTSPAARLVRSARALLEEHAGSLEDLARGCATLEEVGERLGHLSPGVGAGTVVRFLRPLRELWTAAREIPLQPAALAAARHLGWIGPGDDEEGEPAAFLAFLAEAPDAPPLWDVEAALERLGRTACLKDQPARCPLGPACPALRTTDPQDTAPR